MHLQVLLVVTLLGCVCSRHVPRVQLQRPFSIYRPRRFAMANPTTPIEKHQILPNKEVAERRYSRPFHKEQEEEEEYEPANYEFKYEVHDKDHHDLKSHEEKRDGEHTVGQYSVLQPDGTILTVKYTVHGDEGFNAVVSRSEANASF